MRKLRILGAGVRACLTADLVAWQFGRDVEIDGYYDDRREIGPGGKPVVGTIAQALAELPGLDCEAFVALGLKASAKAYEVTRRLLGAGVHVASLVAPACHVSPSARVGRNVLAFPGTFIGAEVVIGDLVCVHGGVTIEHNSTVGHNVHFGPGASLCGSVTVGDHCYVGAGATVLPERIIEVGVLIGAGALVTRDIARHTVVMGQPARRVRATRDGDELPSAEQLAALAGMGLS